MPEGTKVRVPPLFIRHAMRGLPIQVVCAQHEVTLTPMEAIRFAQSLLRSAEAEISKEWQ